MPHWKDQFLHKSAAKAAEEEKRVADSETWEPGDPEKGERSGGSLRMGSRAASPTPARFVRGKPGAGISLRATGGAKFEIPGREPQPVDDEDYEPPSAAKYLPKNVSPPPAPKPEAAPVEEPRPEGGVFSRITSLFRKSKD